MTSIQEPNDHHRSRKQQIKARLQQVKMADAGFKAVTPALIYNLSLEPALKFNIGLFSDRGEDISGRTSAKLQDNVLYFETNDSRYEISKMAGSSLQEPRYRLAKVHTPYGKDNSFMASTSIPLPEDMVETKYSGLDWHDLAWGEQMVIVKGSETIIPIKNYKYYPIR
jgi:hypothetical protein